MQPILISVSDVVAMTGLSRTTIYRRIADGTLPRPMKIGHRSLWLKSEFLEALSALRCRVSV